MFKVFYNVLVWSVNQTYDISIFYALWQFLWYVKSESFQHDTDQDPDLRKDLRNYIIFCVTIIKAMHFLTYQEYPCFNDLSKYKSLNDFYTSLNGNDSDVLHSLYNELDKKLKHFESVFASSASKFSEINQANIDSFLTSCELLHEEDDVY